jgi:hypothetical protein
MKHQSTLPNAAIGLESASIGEAKFDEQVYTFIAEKHSKRGLMGDTLKQARVPKGTVAPENKLRKSILQLSLFPNVVNKRGMKRSPGNVDFGDEHMIPS